MKNRFFLAVIVVSVLSLSGCLNTITPGVDTVVNGVSGHFDAIQPTGAGTLMELSPSGTFEITSVVTSQYAPNSPYKIDIPCGIGAESNTDVKVWIEKTPEKDMVRISTTRPVGDIILTGTGKGESVTYCGDFFGTPGEVIAKIPNPPMVTYVIMGRIFIPDPIQPTLAPQNRPENVLRMNGNTIYLKDGGSIVFNQKLSMPAVRKLASTWGGIKK